MATKKDNRSGPVTPWQVWCARRHPVLLVVATLLAALVAFSLLITNVSTPAILYKAF